MPALPRPENLRRAITALRAQQRLRQAMITRPGHHLHRTLHRNIDWWAARDAPFEPHALQVGKSLQMGKSLQLGKSLQNATTMLRSRARSITDTPIVAQCMKDLSGELFIAIKSA
jgi:hypothetical protein